MASTSKQQATVVLSDLQAFQPVIIALIETHGAKLGDKEVIPSMVRRRILLNIGKCHELDSKEFETKN